MKKIFRGFTILELLVVLAVIGLIASFTFASLEQARKSAYNSKEISDVERLQLALQIFYSEHGYFPACPDSSNPEGPCCVNSENTTCVYEGKTYTDLHNTVGFNLENSNDRNSNLASLASNLPNSHSLLYWGPPHDPSDPNPDPNVIIPDLNNPSKKGLIQANVSYHSLYKDEVVLPAGVTGLACMPETFGGDFTASSDPCLLKLNNIVQTNTTLQGVGCMDPSPNVLNYDKTAVINGTCIYDNGTQIPTATCTNDIALNYGLQGDCVFSSLPRGCGSYLECSNVGRSRCGPGWNKTGVPSTGNFYDGIPVPQGTGCGYTSENPIPVTTKEPNGATCSSNSVCQSNFCLITSGSGSGTHGYCSNSSGIPDNGGCTYGSQCASGVCTNNICVPASPNYPPGSTCTSNSQCANGSCVGGLCAGISNCSATNCTQSGQCSSNYCTSGSAGNVCSTRQVGSCCSNNSDCFSGYCNGSSLCALKPTGYSCSGNSECSSGNCYNTVCEPVGYCYYNSDCNYQYTCNNTSHVCVYSGGGGGSGSYPSGTACTSHTQCSSFYCKNMVNGVGVCN